MMRIPSVGQKILLKWPCMSREKCPQHIRFLGQAMAGGLSGAVLDAYDDHRLAMSLAVVGLKVPGSKIKDEHYVNKSFPGFWKLWDRL
jgi:5-enolpyruvylshikimate-3-phosphate synthase